MSNNELPMAGERLRRDLSELPATPEEFTAKDAAGRGGGPCHGTKLIVVRGSMFSGKTQRMIAWLREVSAAGGRVLAIKHAIDDRYDPESLSTHPGDHFPARRAIDAADILTIVDDAGGNSEAIGAVAIDEAHFFGASLTPVVQALRERGVTVMVAGIRHDAWGRPFTPMPELAALADEVIDCQAPCSVCGQPSPFTQRLTAVLSPTMVGGPGDYEPRCAAHFSPLPVV